MDSDILNLEQAAGFLGISEKTLIKLLREEHIPARKIGREWRFSREALVHWLAAGDSVNYINLNDRYMVHRDMPAELPALFRTIRENIDTLEQNGNRIRTLLPDVEKNIVLPKEATLRVSYKQQREVEKLEFKIFGHSGRIAGWKPIRRGEKGALEILLRAEWLLTLKMKSAENEIFHNLLPEFIGFIDILSGEVYTDTRKRQGFLSD